MEDVVEIFVFHLVWEGYSLEIIISSLLKHVDMPYDQHLKKLQRHNPSSPYQAQQKDDECSCVYEGGGEVS